MFYDVFYTFGRLITDLLCFQEVVEKNLKKRRVGAESVDSTASASSNLEPFANDELGTFRHKIFEFLE